VYSLALQGTGKSWRVAISRRWPAVRNRIGRLNNTEQADQNLSFDGSTVTWLRDGTCPEVWRTTFDASTTAEPTGLRWVPVHGRRGLAVDGVSVLANANIRARGFVTGGRHNVSSWFVEVFSGPPLFVAPPSSRTNNFGTTATFSVNGLGHAALDLPVAQKRAEPGRRGNVSGVQSSTLTLSNVLSGDAGATALW